MLRFCSKAMLTNNLFIYYADDDDEDEQSVEIPKKCTELEIVLWNKVHATCMKTKGKIFTQQIFQNATQNNATNFLYLFFFFWCFSLLCFENRKIIFCYFIAFGFVSLFLWGFLFCYLIIFHRNTIMHFMISFTRWIQKPATKIATTKKF